MRKLLNVSFLRLKEKAIRPAGSPLNCAPGMGDS
jgi:hypothetical protein